MDQKNIRNFCIIAHIDHGKSTLADRFLELTGTVEKRQMKEQVLDTMDLERERGITIKLQPVRMTYRLPQTNTDNKTQTKTDGKALKDTELLYEDLTYKIRGAVFKVRKKLGTGHKENVYHNALKLELEKQSIPFSTEKEIEVIYEGKSVGKYRPDLIVDDKVIVELKALPYIGDPVKKQAWNYLKGSPYELELLVNFGPNGAEIERLIDYPKNRSQSQSGSSPSESVNEIYELNLIDTPGHVDFSYEVSRSLQACEGAVLVVDATQGIQAQTLANVALAREAGLKLIPVINKIDLPAAEPEETALEIKEALGFEDDEILFASGKTGEGVDEILKAVIERVSPPEGSEEEPLQALIFDSIYDKHRGVVAYVRVVNGGLKKGQELLMMATGAEAEVLETGSFQPQLKPSESLGTGQIGYVVTGLRELEKVRVGDTITELEQKAVKPLPGYKEVKPMVFASIFPVDADDYPTLRDAMQKLKLSDSALTFEPENIPSIGFGFRTGFLGLLHMDIVQERLSREFDLDLVLTAPSVSYKVRKTDGQEIKIFNPAELPDVGQIESILEPWVRLEVLTQERYMGAIMELVTAKRGVYKETVYLGPGRMSLHYEIPLANIISDFYDKLKGSSQGYASMNYTFIEYREADLVKVDVLVAGEKADPLSFITHQSVAENEGRVVVEKLKEYIPKQQFAVALQAAIGGKIIARETISAMRKDVTAKLYGGDVTRKQKLLKKQKAGKKRLKKIGKVDIPQKAFLALMGR